MEYMPRELSIPAPRRGKWSPEEERYTEKVIADFANGTLNVSEGTTLRTYLSRALNCDPMRITKKYTGDSAIGKRTFQPLARSAATIGLIDTSQRELEELRRIWVNKLLLAEQWNSRKAGHAVPEALVHNPVAVDQESVNREQNMRNALAPYMGSGEIEHLLHWLRASTHALQGDRVEELEYLIRLGDVSVPALHKLLAGDDEYDSTGTGTALTCAFAVAPSAAYVPYPMPMPMQQPYAWETAAPYSTFPVPQEEDSSRPSKRSRLDDNMIAVQADGPAIAIGRTATLESAAQALLGLFNS